MVRATSAFGLGCDGDGVDTPDARCALVAGEQHGCLSLAQAEACRLSKKAIRGRVATKRWKKLLPGVFVVNGAPGTWEQRLFAAVLWVGEGAAVSGAAAAALWELPGFRRGPVEISHPGTKQGRSGVAVRRVTLRPSDIMHLGVIPVTTPPRTLADIAGRIGDRALDVALHHCLHHRLTTIEALRETAEEQARQRNAGAARMRRALEAYSASERPAASPLEAAVARRLRKAGLPPPRRQHEVVTSGGRRYLDFAWPDARIAVEVDGYRWHSSRTAWENDRTRLAELRRMGWTVIHVTHGDLSRDFEVVVDEIRRNL